MKDDITQKGEDDKTARGEDYYFARAVAGFKTMVIYYCVTRPQFEKDYMKDGKFSADVLLQQMKFLDEWDSRSKWEKKSLARVYAKYARTFNYTFGIPRELVGKITGTYTKDGKTVRVNQEKVVDALVKEGFMRVVNHGSRGKKDENGSYEKTAWWTKKYLLANIKHWLALLNDSRYSDYRTYPNMNEFKERAVKIIAKFRKKSLKTDAYAEASQSQKDKIDEVSSMLMREECDIDSACGILKDNGFSKAYCEQFRAKYDEWRIRSGKTKETT